MTRKYDDSFPLRAQDLARQGMDNAGIAARLGVSPRTLKAYRKRHQEFDEALKRGKDHADAEVENALLRKATGYKRKETVLEDIVSRDTGKVTEQIKRRIAIREVPPDTPAARFWLMNRRPDLWSRKQDSGIPDQEGKVIIELRQEDAEL